MSEASTGKTDEQLVRAAVDGREEAFRALYERHSGRVYRTARGLLGSEEEAEDCTQEIFIRAHRRMGSLGDPTALTSWLYRMTVNACYDRMRKEERRSKHHGSLPEEPPERSVFGEGRWSSPEQEAARAEARRLISAGLAELSPELRATFVLKEREGRSYREIAHITGCAEGTVGSRLARARRQLAAYLRDRGVDPASVTNL